MDASRGQHVLETIELLVDAEARGLAGLDTVALRRLAAESVAVQSWLAAFDTRIATAAAALTIGGLPVDAEPIVSGGGRRSRREAAAAVDRAKTCAVVPGIGDALAAGDLAAGHVDAVVAVTRNMSDAARERFAEHAAELVDNGRFETPEEFGRRCKRLAGRVIDEAERLERQERCRRQRTVRRWSDPDGMCHTKLSLDPLADARIWAVIETAFGIARNADQSGDDRSFDQLRADVVVDLLARSTTGGDDLDVGGGRGVNAEVSVLVDLATLLGRADGAGIAMCETGDGQPLPVATVRRLCCDGRVLPVVLNGTGVPTDLGRAQRLASRAQRQALRAMYASCAHPQCTVGFERCRIHHVTFWERSGPTDLTNLIPVCERHHHLVHEGGWTLTLDPDRTAVWTAPDGRVVHHGDSRNRWTTDTTRVAIDSTGTAATAGTTAAARRHPGIGEPIPLFGHDDATRLFAHDDATRRRGPPRAG